MTRTLILTLILTGCSRAPNVCTETRTTIESRVTMVKHIAIPESVPVDVCTKWERVTQKVLP